MSRLIDGFARLTQDARTKSLGDVLARALKDQLALLPNAQRLVAARRWRDMSEERNGEMIASIGMARLTEGESWTQAIVNHADEFAAATVEYLLDNTHFEEVPDA